MISFMRTCSRHWLVLCISLLLGGTTLLAVRTDLRRKSVKTVTRLDDWDMPRLLAYLSDRGLSLRPVSSSANGNFTNGVFLTRTSMELPQLNYLPRVRERIDLWQGTIFCQPFRDPELWDIQIADWGDCCLIVPPFLFFGDRELLAAVLEALDRVSDAR